MTYSELKRRVETATELGGTDFDNQFPYWLNEITRRIEVSGPLSFTFHRKRFSLDGELHGDDPTDDSLPEYQIDIPNLILSQEYSVLLVRNDDHGIPSSELEHVTRLPVSPSLFQENDFGIPSVYSAKRYNASTGSETGVTLSLYAPPRDGGEGMTLEISGYFYSPSVSEEEEAAISPQGKTKRDGYTNWLMNHASLLMVNGISSLCYQHNGRNEKFQLAHNLFQAEAWGDPSQGINGLVLREKRGAEPADGYAVRVDPPRNRENFQFARQVGYDPQNVNNIRDIAVQLLNEGFLKLGKGNAFPASPQEDDAFFLTEISGNYGKGLYLLINNAWERVESDATGDAGILDAVENWAKAGNADEIPVIKLPSARNGAGIIAQEDWEKIQNAIDAAHLHDTPMLLNDHIDVADAILLDDASIADGDGSQLKEISFAELDKRWKSTGITPAQAASLAELLTFEAGLKTNKLIASESLRQAASDAATRFSAVDGERPKLPPNRFDRELLVTVGGQNPHRFYVKDLENKGGVNTAGDQLTGANSISWQDGNGDYYRISYLTGDRELVFAADNVGDYAVNVTDYQIDLADFARISMSGTQIPAAKVPVYDWSKTGNADKIPAEKLPDAENAGGFATQIGAAVTVAIGSSGNNAGQSRRLKDTGLDFDQTYHWYLIKAKDDSSPDEVGTYIASKAEINALAAVAAGDSPPKAKLIAFASGMDGEGFFQIARTAANDFLVSMRDTGNKNLTITLFGLNSGARGPKGDKGDPGSGGLTQRQVDARVEAGVEDWAETGDRDRIPESKLPAKAESFFADTTEGGWKFSADMQVQTGAMPAAKPSLATAAARAYAVTGDRGPRYQNVWDMVRVPKGRSVTDARYAIGEKDLAVASFANIAGSSWESLGTQGAYDYYAVQIADKPADDDQFVEEFGKFRIDGGKVEITGVGSHPFLKINSGSGTGLAITSSGQDKRLANAVGFDTAFDLDDADKQSGILQVEATVQLVSRSDNAIGFNSGASSANAVIRAQIEGFKFVSALRASTAYSATENGLLVGSVDVYKGNVTLGELELYLTRDANNVAGYWFVWEGASGADTFSVSVNEMDVAFIHNDPGDASSGAPAKVLLDDLPAVGTHTEGQSVYVKRGTGANQKIWEYTILGAGAARKWVKTAGDDGACWDRIHANVSTHDWKITGFAIPAWADNMSSLTANDSANVFTSRGLFLPMPSGTRLTASSTEATRTSFDGWFFSFHQEARALLALTSIWEKRLTEYPFRYGGLPHFSRCQDPYAVEGWAHFNKEELNENSQVFLRSYVFGFCRFSANAQLDGTYIRARQGLGRATKPSRLRTSTSSRKREVSFVSTKLFGEAETQWIWAVRTGLFEISVSFQKRNYGRILPPVSRHITTTATTNASPSRKTIRGGRI